MNARRGGAASPMPRSSQPPEHQRYARELNQEAKARPQGLRVPNKEGLIQTDRQTDSYRYKRNSLGEETVSVAAGFSRQRSVAPPEVTSIFVLFLNISDDHNFVLFRGSFQLNEYFAVLCPG
ncbi:hypothetical protein ATANTOWER_017882 [Ataeniobius toweri]|uniref:Uncharacterized protein n=1 Tax=Ataeniobius toweri TaxID=208326 RepID=A0ABU7AGM2_9TELE|nr:hypothetical protein [Ataeniobius toweri]